MFYACVNNSEAKKIEPPKYVNSDLAKILKPVKIVDFHYSRSKECFDELDERTAFALVRDLRTKEEFYVKDSFIVYREEKDENGEYSVACFV